MAGRSNFNASFEIEQSKAKPQIRADVTARYHMEPLIGVTIYKPETETGMREGYHIDLTERDARALADWIKAVLGVT